MLLVSLLIASTMAAEVTRLGSAPLTPDPAASSPAVADDGTLWLVQPGGLVSLSPDGWRWGWVRSAEIVESGAPSLLTMDVDGSLWVAFDTGTLARSTDDGWRRYIETPWSDQEIRALHPTPGGGVLIETSGTPGLWQAEDDGWVLLITDRPAPLALWLTPDEAWAAYDDELQRFPLAAEGAGAEWPPPAPALDLAVTPEGAWLASEAGLWQLDPDAGTWTLALEHSTRLLSVSDGVWAAGARALWYGGAEAWAQIPVETDAEIRQISHGPDGTTWVTSRQWVLRWDQQRWTYVHTDDLGGPVPTMAHGPAHSWAVEPGTWRLFDEDGAIVQQVDLAWHPQTPTTPFRQLFVKDETAWGLGRELYRISTALQKRQRFHDGPAEALAIDHAGHPWLQLHDELRFHDGLSWQSVPLPTQDAPGTSPPQAPGAEAWPELLGTPSGQVLLALGGSVYRRDGERWEDLGRPIEAEWSPGPIMDHPAGGVLLGTSHGLLYLDAGGAWHPLPVHSSGAVTALLHTRDGSLWIGTSAGLCVRSPTGHYRVASRLAGQSVLNLFEQDDGSLLVDLEDSATLLLHPDDLRVSHTSYPQAHLRWRDPAGRVWTSTSRSTRWTDGITERTVVGPPSHSELSQPPGGELISGDPPIILAEGAAAWYRDGRWVGTMHPSPAPVGLVADAVDDWTMLLADGTLHTLTPSGLLPHRAVLVGHATDLVRWNDTLCASGSLGLRCRDEQGEWQPRDGVHSVQNVAVQGNTLLLVSQGQLQRLGRRGAPRPVASLEDLSGEVTALVVGADGLPWVGTDAGVLAHLESDGWAVLHSFDAPVRGLATTTTTMVVRAGDELFEVTP
jgi:hypothetical protein